jgi:DNA-binding response OmpR family regulator
MAGETVLVIDADPEMRRLLKNSILAPLGYRVISALDGESGLEAAVHHSPDLILLNMSMPGLSGLEMLEALRRTTCKSPVIFMTSYGTEKIAVEAFRLGVRDYLNKPFTPEEVARAVDRALHEPRLAREREELSHELLTAEAVRVTVVTLSHYLNSNLMAISGSLTLLSEALELEQPETDVDEIIQKGQVSLRGIQAVLNVLVRTTNVKITPYSETAPMIDIAAALEAELQKIPASPPPARRLLTRWSGGEGDSGTADGQDGTA